MPEVYVLELSSIVGVLRRRWALVAGITVGVLVLTLMAFFKAPKLWRGQALLKVEDVAMEQAALGSVRPGAMTQSRAGEDRNRVSTAAAMMTTPPVIDSLVTKLQLKNKKGELRYNLRTTGPWFPLFPYPDVCVKCTPLENTSMIRVRGYGRTAEEAQRVTNTLVDAYLAEKEEGNRRQLRAALAFLDGQTAEMSDTFARKRRALQNYQEAHGTVDPDRETAAAIQRLMRLKDTEQQCLLDLRTAETSLQPLYQELTKVLSAQMLDQLASSSGVGGLQSRLEELEAGRSDPDESEETHQERQREIDAVREQLREAILPTSRIPEDVTQSASQNLLNRYLDGRVQVISLTAQHDAITRLIADQRGELRAIPQQVSSLLPLELDSDAAAETYRVALEQRGSLAVGAAIEASDVWLICYAKPSTSPNIPFMLIDVPLGLFIGLGLGIFTTMVVEHRHGRIRTVEKLQQVVAAPLLGAIPRAGRREIRRSLRLDPKSSHTRFYRSMRNALWNGGNGKRCRTAALVSARPGEGRTSVCVGLALSSAHEYGRVLMVDVDLQRPALHRRFNVPAMPGLTDHLFHGAPLEDVVRPTEIPGLSVLPAGTVADDTGAVLRSPEFRDLMAGLQERFDYILFDTPPALVVNDVVLLRDWVDKTIVLARAGRTREQDIDALLGVLQSAGLKPTHTVLVGGPGA